MPRALRWSLGEGGSFLCVRYPCNDVELRGGRGGSNEVLCPSDPRATQRATKGFSDRKCPSFPYLIRTVGTSLRPYGLPTAGLYVLSLRGYSKSLR
eukprot:CAMPEP_0180283510 /NCGR_PEP_ID=MMETSP0988-20121125/10537_1 /TAXON_ID=697907 /ORGANISM="non described non described, Strain CCMP2293" /LENGTH=95 /DNA_ID=CAMNT_0022256093 /DNA_START=19 /DNA_END=302 /DNA_ORIENTATION=-